MILLAYMHIVNEFDSPMAGTFFAPEKSSSTELSLAYFPDTYGFLFYQKLLSSGSAALSFLTAGVFSEGSLYASYRVKLGSFFVEPVGAFNFAFLNKDFLAEYGEVGLSTFGWAFSAGFLSGYRVLLGDLTLKIKGGAVPLLSYGPWEEDLQKIFFASLAADMGPEFATISYVYPDSFGVLLGRRFRILTSFTAHLTLGYSGGSFIFSGGFGFPLKKNWELAIFLGGFSCFYYAGFSLRR